MFLKWSSAALSSTESVTSLLRAVFSVHAKKIHIKITASVVLGHFLPPVFPDTLHLKASKGKRLFLFLPLNTHQGPGRECIVQWSKAFPAPNEDQNPSSRLNY